MPIESATYIPSLDINNPASSDGMADGDNHLRLIKSVLKNTFPNVDAAVTGKATNLNAYVPIGGIILWSGSVASIPSGWVLCAGQVGLTKSDGTGTINAPDLRSRFVVGAGDGTGGTLAVGATGGSTTLTGTTDTQGSHSHSGSTDTQGNHTHGGSTQGHSLTEAEMPPHTHTFTRTDSGLTTVVAPTAATAVLISVSQVGGVATGSTGSGSAHSHVINNDGSHAHNVTTGASGSHAHATTITDGRPPYFALAYIMRI